MNESILKLQNCQDLINAEINNDNLSTSNYYVFYFADRKPDCMSNAEISQVYLKRQLLHNLNNDPLSVVHVNQGIEETIYTK